jgi:hypothetical protein
MKNAYEVLYQKEADLARVRQEVESLQIAASLLSDDEFSYFAPDASADGQSKKPAEKAGSPTPDAEATGTDGLSSTSQRPGFWESLKFSRG